MPIDRDRYPDNWEDIAKAVKNNANWCCTKCYRQCLRPGEGNELSRSARAVLTLTVHHANFTPEDNRLENLIALCAPCHLSAHSGSKGNVSIGQLSLW